MFGNLLFGLTFITYIALSIFNLQKVNATGDRLVGWGVIAFVLLAVYVVCSLILTISITAKGGFNWVSNSVSLRNTAVSILWLGMVAGVVFCTVIRAEFRADDQLTGFVRWLSLPVYFGATWLPLLMLMPYAILLNTEWRDTLSPNLYKIPLVLGCVIGLSIILAPKIVNTAKSLNALKESDSSQWAFNNSMRTINNYNEQSISGLLTFTHREQDARLRNTALVKIKSYKNWESELISTLAQNNPYNIYWVYAFLDGNKIEHPENFIKPINNSIPLLTSEIQNTIKDPYKDNLSYIDIEALCRVLETQFKDSREVFRPNVLKLQETLETPPVARMGTIDKQKFVETLNKYQLAVKNWLNSH